MASSKKGAKRYRTKETDQLLNKMSEAEDKRDTALKDIMRRIFHSFDKK